MKKHHTLLAFSSCLLIGGIAGFMMGQQNTPAANNTSQSVVAGKAETEEVLSNKTATFQGEIVRFDGSTVQLKDEKGKTQAFPVDQKLMINKINSNGSQGSPSADLKQIEMGRQAYVFLKYMDGQYKVNYISFLPK